MRSALLLLLSACACASLGPPPTRCVTRCGLMLVGDIPKPSDFSYGPGWTCAEFQRAEDESLRAFKVVVDPRFRAACAALKGYRVSVNPAVSWESSYGNGPISGETHCAFQNLDVCNLPPVQSTMTHELGHVIQRCESRGPEDYADHNDDDTHSNWGSDRIWGAIASVHAVGDVDYARCIHADAGTPGCDR